MTRSANSGMPAGKVPMPTENDIMDSVRAMFKSSGLSLADLGRRMGYKHSTASRSAWQFLNKTVDPRLSMLRKFSAALGVPLYVVASYKPPKESHGHDQ